MKRYCIVNDEKCEFLGIFQHSHTHGDSILVGGFKAGTVAYPVVVYVDKDGSIKQTDTQKAKMVDE